MRILHRIARTQRLARGPGLNGHVPMPPGATGTAAELQPDFSLSADDLKVLDLARAVVPGLGPAARSRGRHLAEVTRAEGGGASDRELLTGLLPVLHWLRWAELEGIFPASWGHAATAVLAACWELNGGGDEAGRREAAP